MANAGDAGDDEAEDASRSAAAAAAAAASAAQPTSIASDAVDLMCRGSELGDEGLELQLLKGLLTAVSCSSFQARPPAASATRPNRGGNSDASKQGRK